MFVTRLAAIAAFGFAATSPALALTAVDSGSNGVVVGTMLNTKTIALAGNGTATSPNGGITRNVAVTGGNTAVRVTANLGALGLTPSLLGSASPQSGNRIFFPITGGDLNPATLAGFILHAGSGVRLTGSGGTTLDLRNFRIDTVTNFLSGDVTGNGTTITGVNLFAFSLSGLTPAQITNLANPVISLRFTADSASVLTRTFGAPNLTGAEFAVAATAPILQTAVPEPATWAMLILGFGVIGISLRARRVKVSFI